MSETPAIMRDRIRTASGELERLIWKLAYEQPQHRLASQMLRFDFGIVQELCHFLFSPFQTPLL
jgi:hypothetical protein